MQRCNDRLETWKDLTKFRIMTFLSVVRLEPLLPLYMSSMHSTKKNFFLVYDKEGARFTFFKKERWLVKVLIFILSLSFISFFAFLVDFPCSIVLCCIYSIPYIEKSKLRSYKKRRNFENTPTYIHVLVQKRCWRH